MESFKLNEYGNPVLLEHETEIINIPKVTISVHGGSPLINIADETLCIVRLTNFRICFQAKNGLRFQVLLRMVASVEDVKRLRMFATNQVNIQLSSTLGSLILVFSDYKYDFLEKFQIQLEKKSWLKYENKKKEIASSEFSTEKAGLLGLLKNQNERKKQDEESIKTAFKDLNSLFDQAEIMVGLANKISNRLKTTQTEDDEDDNTFHAEIMEKMGIWTPVTRNTHRSKDLYFQELSKQVAQFITTRVFTEDKFWTPSENALMPSVERKDIENLKIAQHTISLTDLYCIFNRARGTELISPEDLLEACRQFEKLKLPMRIQKLNSGCLIVVSMDHNEKNIATKVAQFVQQLGKITSLELSTFQRISITLAQHYLERAEQMEQLCRDDSFQGLVFYPNLFKEVHIK